MKRILHNRVPFIWILLNLDMYYKTVWLCQCDNVFKVFSGYQVSCILILPVFYTQPIGGAWRPPLQYIPLTPPVQPALRWLHLYDTPSPCHSLLQAPPTAAEQPGYSLHELHKLASCALIETGLSGAESWRVALALCRMLLSLQPFSFLKRKELLWLGWPCCDSVSAYILKSAAQSWRRCSEVRVHQRWMETTWGQRRPTTLSLRVSTSSLVRPSTAAHQTLKGFFFFFLVTFVYPSNHTSLFGISSTVPKHMAEPGLYIHISVFRYAGILLGLN